MTGLPIIETKGNDVSAYIPTNVISITDGQIFLESDLFNSGRPAGHQRRHLGLPGRRQRPDQGDEGRSSGSLRLDLAQYRELEAFSAFGSDLDKASEAQLERGARLVELLKQPQYDPFSVERQVVSIWAGTTGQLDVVPVAGHPALRGRVPRLRRPRPQADLRHDHRRAGSPRGRRRPSCSSTRSTTSRSSSSASDGTPRRRRAEEKPSRGLPRARDGDGVRARERTDSDPQAQRRQAAAGRDQLTWAPRSGSSADASGRCSRPRRSPARWSSSPPRASRKAQQRSQAARAVRRGDHRRGLRVASQSARRPPAGRRARRTRRAPRSSSSPATAVSPAATAPTSLQAAEDAQRAAAQEGKEPVPLLVGRKARRLLPLPQPRRRPTAGPASPSSRRTPTPRRSRRPDRGVRAGGDARTGGVDEIHIVYTRVPSRR